MRTASLVTAAVVLLLLSRSEIRKSLLANAAILPLVAAVLWLVVFLSSRERTRSRRRNS